MRDWRVNIKKNELPMQVWIGLRFFTEVRANDYPRVALQALDVFSHHASSLGDSVYFQGQFARTLDFSDLQVVSQQSLAELNVDLLGGVFDRVIALKTLTREGQPHLAFDTEDAITKGRFRVSVKCVFDVLHSNIFTAIGIGRELWSVFEPAYGVCIAGVKYLDVATELIAYPDTSSISGDPYGYSDARDKMGTFVGPATWGTFLSSRLVSRLGGKRFVRKNAPVELVTDLCDGGSFLQLTNDDALLPS